MTRFINVAPGNSSYYSEDDVLYSYDQKVLLCVPKTIRTFVVPSWVTKIGKGAFQGCSRLMFVFMLPSVTEIGDDAFCGCQQLLGVEMSKSVTKIGNRAFCGCSRLVGVVIPNRVKTVGKCAFYGCTALEIVRIPKATRRKKNAFEECPSLTIFRHG